MGILREHFLTPLFLVGLAGALLPLLIHLLTRDRIRKENFSTLRFFVKSSGRVLRRKRFRELMLLLLRAAVCALLAVAFARPLLNRRPATDGGVPVVKAGTARVVVVDVSASMTRAGGAEAIRRAAREALAGLSQGRDAVAVLAFDAHAETRAPMATSFAEAEAAIAALAPGQGATDIPQALRAADTELKRADADRKEIVLISDLQRSGWQELREDFKLSPGVRLVIPPLRAEAPAAAAAILAASFPDTTVLDREPSDITVQVVNYLHEPLEGVTVRFALDAKAEARKVNLRAGGTAAATFRHVFETAGDHRGTIALGDGGETFYFNTRVIPKIKVVVVYGGASDGRLSDAAFYLETAMAPARDVPSPFDCKTRSVSAITPGQLAEARVAVLVNVGQVSPAVRRALRELLARGGGLLLLPGGRVEPKAFAESLGELAPCKLRRVRTGRVLGTGQVGVALAKIDYQHPIFEIFSHPRHGDLSLAKFRRYWEVTDSQLSRALAKFDDNRPAVLAREIDGGVSMMLASCPDDDWTDFAKQTTFLPFVWQTLKYLAARTERKTAYTVGDSLPVPDGHRLVGPGGKPVAGGAPVAEAPGFYVLTDAAGKAVATFAANRDPAESNPATVAAEEIVAAVVPAGAGDLAEAGAAADRKDHDDRADERDLWRWVLLAVTVLLAGELLLGNKTLRH